MSGAAGGVLLALTGGLPAVAGAALVVLAASHRWGWAARRAAPAVSVAVAGAVVIGAFTLAASAGHPTLSAPFVAGATFGLAVDGLSGLVIVTVCVVAALVLVFSTEHIHRDPARFHGLMLVFVAAVLVTATATTLPALIVGWEVMGAASYALIGFPWRAEHSMRAGMSALLTTRTADLGLYVAAAAALAGSVADGQGGSLARTGGDAPLALDALSGLSPGWRSVAAAGLLVAAAGKAAQLPFSFWLSGAMAGPSPVSALLHSAAMVAMGGYLLLRVAPLLTATGWAATAAAWLGALSALALGAVALAQTDLKQTLAASTVAQLGYVVLAAGVGAVSAGAAQLAAHAATKSLLFLAAGVWLVARGGSGLADMAGAARDQRLVGFTFTVGALALAGVPPLSLWASKDSVLAAAGEQSALLYGVGLTGAALSAAYAAKILAVVWAPQAQPPQQLQPQPQRQPQAGGSRVGSAQALPLVVLAVAAAGAGLLALPPFGAQVGRWVTTSAPGPGGPGPQGGVLGQVDPAQATGSALLALVVTAAAFWAARRGWTWAWRPARHWLGLPTAVTVVVTGPVEAAATRLARFDDGVDAAVEGVGRSGLAAARCAAALDAQRVDGAVQGLARGVRAAGSAVRRLQTGLIHQYYAQALVLLAGLVIVVWLVR